MLDFLGPGRTDRPQHPIKRCYYLKTKRAFLTVIIDDEDPARAVTSVLVTAVPNCDAAEPSNVVSQLTACRAVGLGDPVENLKNVGATERESTEKGYPWYGTGPEVSQFDYRCQPERECSVMASAYVRAGRIVGVSVWSPDC